MLNRILVTGGGNAGSWQVRGVQLGAAIDAYSVKPRATLAEMKEHAIIIVVKRVDQQVRTALRNCGRLVIWDCVDAYPQPNHMGRGEAISHMLHYAQELGARFMIGATKRMAVDLGTSYDLPHHGWARPGFQLRREVKNVVYEGHVRYIAGYRAFLEAECARRGWHFLINPERYVDGDIAVSFRGREWDGYTTRCWKSNVKLANAQVTGMPFVGTPEAGYRETASGEEVWAETQEEIRAAFDYLTPYEVREKVHRSFLSHAPTLPSIARRYREILRSCVMSSY